MTDMEQKYDDFNGVGKRMPYTLPDDFLATLEQNVMHDVTTTNRKPNRRAKVIKLLTQSSIAAAVAIALVVGYKAFFTTKPVDNSYAAMEQAFENLSEEDQEYLLEVYQEDIFLDGITNEI